MHSWIYQRTESKWFSVPREMEKVDLWPNLAYPVGEETIGQSKYDLHTFPLLSHLPDHVHSTRDNYLSVDY